MRNLTRAAALGWLVALPAAAPLAGQGNLQAPSQWLLSGSQGSWCLEYLVDSASAAKLAPKGAVLLPASSSNDLNPILERVIRDEPQFARWIPASFCFGLYAQVNRDGSPVVEMKSGKPLIFAIHTLAARSFHGDSVNQVALAVYLENGTLARAWDRAGQTSKKIKWVRTPPDQDHDPKTQLEFDGVKLTWDGSARGDTSVAVTRKVSFGYVAQRGNEWVAQVEWSGGEEQKQYGALGVQGKNTLAKALLASPIRVMGAEERGGSLSFSLRVVTQQ